MSLAKPFESIVLHYAARVHHRSLVCHNAQALLPDLLSCLLPPPPLLPDFLLAALLPCFLLPPPDFLLPCLLAA